MPAPAAAARPVTTFPAPLPHGGSAELLYTLARGTFVGLPLQRVVALAVLLAALTWALRPLPGGGWVAGALLAAMVGVAATRTLYARHAYVSFTPAAEAGTPAPARLPASEKVPVYLWGNLEVQARVRSFVALPGFYRTFATREHALIGRVVARSRFGLAHISDLDEGLWYAFCTPGQVVGVRAGTVRWGRQSYPALALERRVERALEGGRVHSGVEIVYIGAREWTDVARILTDLAVEMQAQTSLQAQRSAH